MKVDVRRGLDLAKEATTVSLFVISNDSISASDFTGWKGGIGSGNPQ